MEIKKLRTSLKWTQTELAVKVGVSLVTIQLWEKNVSQPNEENMKKLKAVLKIKEGEE